VTNILSMRIVFFVGGIVCLLKMEDNIKNYHMGLPMGGH
jgi:hypothetical protein